MKQLPKDLKGKQNFIVGSWAVWAAHLHNATRVGYHLSSVNAKRIRRGVDPLGRCGSVHVDNRKYFWARQPALKDPDLYKTE